MAKEWYLIKPPYGAYDDHETVMNDAIDSAIGDDVEICNYDLTERRSLRVIMGARVQDTELKTRVHYFLCNIGSVKTGEYVYYKDRYWIITGLVDDNGVYEKAVIEVCEYLLTWQEDSGDIVQRWVSAGNATQYNNGETSDGKILFRSDQLKLTLPDDDHTLLMKHNQRFVLDKRTKVYEKHMVENMNSFTSYPLLTYKMTRIDAVSTNYNNCGVVDIMVTQDAQQWHDGYYIIDGRGYWLAQEATDIPNEEKESYKIEYDSNIIYIGVGSFPFMADFLIKNDGSITEHEWQIDEDIKSHLLLSEDEKSPTLLIACNEQRMNGQEFILKLVSDGFEIDPICITIKEFI